MSHPNTEILKQMSIAIGHRLRLVIPDDLHAIIIVCRDCDLQCRYPWSDEFGDRQLRFEMGVHDQLYLHARLHA